MSVKQRLIEFIKYKKMSVRSFEASIGVSYGYVNNIRVSIQPDKITSIARYFPELNTGWLLTGEGEMLKKKGADAQEPLKYYEMDKTNENSTLKDLLYSFKEIAESVKINALANERNAMANEKNANANELNSQNMKVLIEMIQDERKKGDQSLDQSGKEYSAHAG